MNADELKSKMEFLGRFSGWRIVRIQAGMERER
jgi:hypothetical protein